MVGAVPRRKSGRTTGTKRYTDDAFDNIKNIFQEQQPDEQMQKLLDEASIEDVVEREESEFSGADEDMPDIEIDEDENEDEDSQADGFEDEDAAEDEFDPAYMGKKWVKTSRAKQLARKAESRFAKGIVSRFNECFHDEYLRKPAVVDRIRWSGDQILPSHQGLKRSAFCNDEWLEKQKQVAKWYVQDGVRDRLLDNQRGKVMTDIDQLTCYLDQAKKRHSFFIGPAAKLQRASLRRFESAHLSSFWPEAALRDGQHESEVVVEANGCDNEFEASASRPQSSGRSGWLLNLGNKPHMMEWLPKQIDDGYQYLAIATRPLESLDRFELPDKAQQQVAARKAQVEAVKVFASQYAQPPPELIDDDAPVDASPCRANSNSGSDGSRGPSPDRRPYVERFPPGNGALQIWRFAEQLTSNGSVQFNREEPPVLCASLASSRWGKVRHFQACSFSSGMSEILIACVWADGNLRTHILPVRRGDSQPALDPMHHLLEIEQAALELSSPDTQSMVTCWLDAKTLLSGNVDGSITLFDLERAMNGEELAPVTTYHYDRTPILQLGTCQPTYPTLIYSASMAGDIRVFVHGPNRLPADTGESLSPLRSQDRATDYQSRPAATPSQAAEPDDAPTTVTILDFFSNPPSGHTLNHRRLLPGHLSYYPALNSLFVTSASQSDHALTLLPLGPDVFPQAQVLLRYPQAIPTSVATAGPPEYAHPCVLVGYADGTVRASGASLVMKALRGKIAILNQRIVCHEFSRLAVNKGAAGGESDEEGMSRFLEGFPPERGDWLSPYEVTPKPGKAKSGKPVKRRATVETVNGDATGGKGSRRFVKKLEAVASEKVFEERSAVVSLAWNPNLAGEGTAAGTAGWAAMGFGSGLVRVQDLAV